jgi:hypothetical protein
MAWTALWRLERIYGIRMWHCIPWLARRFNGRSEWTKPAGLVETLSVYFFSLVDKHNTRIDSYLQKRSEENFSNVELVAGSDYSGMTASRE